jgi:hypothetical protein
MDNAWPKFAPNARQIPAMVEESIYKGSTSMPWCRMNNKAGRFAQDDNMAVFIEDRQRNRFRLTGAGFWRWNFGPDDIP